MGNNNNRRFIGVDRQRSYLGRALTARSSPLSTVMTGKARVTKKLQMTRGGYEDDSGEIRLLSQNSAAAATINKS